MTGVTLALCLITLVICCGSPQKKEPPRRQLLSDSWQFKEQRTSPAIGNLGGARVLIPEHFVEFLEYDGDPALMEEREGPIPVRTADSRIRSFGFHIRYPDMVGRTPEHEVERKRAPIETTMWLDVSIKSGSRYGDGHDSLERMVAAIDDPKAWRYSLKPLKDAVHGLTGFSPEGARPRDFLNPTLYYHRDARGRVDTYIECANSRYPSAQCTQYLNLQPVMKAHIEVNYRIGLLSSWADIQSSVTRTILSFQP